MPPRKTPTKTVPANGARARTRSWAHGASERLTRSYRTRMKDLSPGNTTSSGDELNAQVEATEENDEEVRDEIVVSGLNQQTKATTDDSLNTPSTEVVSPAATTGQMRRCSRDSSTSKNEAARTTPSRRATPIKKQEFVVAAAADGEDELAAEEPTPKKLRVIAKSTQLAAFRRGHSKWDNPDEMLTNPKAPLANIRLRDLLCNAKAWDILTREEKQQVLAKFPDEAEILDPGTPKARPDVTALRNNNNFRHDVARYQESLRKGYHDLEWIHQAQVAHRKRELGFYNEFMAADFEERWDIPMPIQSQNEELANVGGKGDAISASEEQANGAQDQPDSRIDHRCSDAKAQQQAVEGNPTAKMESSLQHADSITAKVQDGNTDSKDTMGSKAEPTKEPLETSNKAEVDYRDMAVKPLNDAGQSETIATQPPEKPGGHQLEGVDTEVAPLNVPSLDIMEGIERQGAVDAPKSAETQQGHTIEELGKLETTHAQATVKSNHDVAIVKEAVH